MPERSTTAAAAGAAGSRSRPPGWWPAVVGAAAVAFIASATVAGAQGRAAPPSAVLVAGVGVGSPLMVDGNGTTVRLAPAPTVALHLTPRRWRVMALHGGLVIRAASAALRLDDDGERWSAGRAWQLDLLAQASLPLMDDDRLIVAAGAGAIWLRASREPAPLQGALVSPAAEATVLYRPWGPEEWWLVATAQGYRVLPAVGRAGGVGRLTAGVGRAF